MLNAYLFYLSIAGFAGLCFWELYRIRRSLEKIASTRYDITDAAEAVRGASTMVEWFVREVAKATRR